MYLRNRHRRGVYSLATPSPVPRIIKSVVWLVLSLVILYWLGSFVLRSLGIGTTRRHAAVMLLTEGKGLTSVMVQGEEDRTAESGMAIGAGDGVSTGPAANASLSFYDNTWARLAERTEVTVQESTRGEEDDASIALQLRSGELWIRTPASGAGSGVVMRTVDTPALHLTLPTNTEAVIAAGTVKVFSADGAGVTVIAKGADAFTIGEGQKWSLPDDGKIVGDPLAQRSALTAGDLAANFLLQSRQVARIPGEGNVSAADLTLTAPQEGSVVRGSAVRVAGTIGGRTAKVTVNGHEATVDPTSRAFSQDVVPSEGSTDVHLDVKAYDADGTLLQTESRSVRMEPLPGDGALPSPTITAPAATGETYQTNQEEVVIRGTSPAEAAGMMVNEYKLQLFSPEKGTWSYLASHKLGNMKDGPNVYDVYALDATGKKSNPVRLTIVYGTDVTPGTVTASSSASSVALQTNDPTEPGTLTVTGPVAGTEAETGTGVLLEGRTSKHTASVWVNDYRLQLYVAGKTTWNYIASPELGNLKPGPNVFHIVVRDSEGKILDKLDYTVRYAKP